MKENVPEFFKNSAIPATPPSLQRGGVFTYTGLMMQRISDLPADLAAELAKTDLIVFDGECVMCSGFFRFMVARDAGRFRFATAQSRLGQALYAALGLPRTDFETNLVIVDGVIFQRLDAVCTAMKTLGWPWRAFAVARVLPRVVKDPLYHLIARNRYRLFGRYDTCVIPSPNVSARFANGGQ